MARFSAIKFWLHKFRNVKDSTEATASPAKDSARILAAAIYDRETAGLATTLRHLHKISDLTQSEALKAVSKLEQEGLVTIEDDTKDAFESVVTITPALGQQLSADARRNAA